MWDWWDGYISPLYVKSFSLENVPPPEAQHIAYGTLFPLVPVDRRSGSLVISGK